MSHYPATRGTNQIEFYQKWKARNRAKQTEAERTRGSRGKPLPMSFVCLFDEHLRRMGEQTVTGKDRQEDRG
jgi:hypothetical protein